VSVDCIFRSNQWVVNCRTRNLDKKTAAELHKYYLVSMVCGEHFEDRMFMNTTSRNSLVVPLVIANRFKWSLD